MLPVHARAMPAQESGGETSYPTTSGEVGQHLKVSFLLRFFANEWAWWDRRAVVDPVHEAGSDLPSIGAWWRQRVCKVPASEELSTEDSGLLEEYIYCGLLTAKTSWLTIFLCSIAKGRARLVIPLRDTHIC